MFFSLSICDHSHSFFSSFYSLIFISSHLFKTTQSLQNYPIDRMYASAIFTSVLVFSVSVFAVPFPVVTVGQDHLEVLRLRASTTVNPDAVTGTRCIDTTAYVSSITL